MPFLSIKIKLKNEEELYLNRRRKKLRAELLCVVMRAAMAANPKTSRQVNNANFFILYLMDMGHLKFMGSLLVCYSL
jgi:hypothetical protein